MLYPPTRAKLTGRKRETVAGKLGRQYKRGATVDDLARKYGYSWSLTRNLIVEAGVEMRSRGVRAGYRRIA